MFRYLTVTKVFKDCLALLKKHCLYIALMYCIIAIPNYFIKIDENNLSYQVLYMAVTLLVAAFIHIVSISLASTSFLYDKFNFTNKLKEAFSLLIPYTILTIVGHSLAIIGIFVLIIPGLIVSILFSMAKVHFIIHKTDVKGAVTGVIQLFKKSYILEIIKILSLPFLTLFIITQIVFSVVQNQDLVLKYLPLAIIIINPIAVCYSVSLYFNLVKENQLDSPN